MTLKCTVICDGIDGTGQYHAPNCPIKLPPETTSRQATLGALNMYQWGKDDLGHHQSPSCYRAAATNLHKRA